MVGMVFMAISVPALFLASSVMIRLIRRDKIHVLYWIGVGVLISTLYSSLIGFLIGQAILTIKQGIAAGLMFGVFIFLPVGILAGFLAHRIYNHLIRLPRKPEETAQLTLN